ncbi:Alpha/Beta hydrolase protein [Cristinia sonorae]|uniref:Alpha/Beta hydrolase protein n=1 Tax=Cristinia sonorae TaxID=1940300 RepID=A0A8K0UW52_9AGAR|nr:Alpha/Beta hydrolase protein [Cristinia sonorae]
MPLTWRKVKERAECSTAKKMYALEKEVNFRWASKVFGTYGKRELTHHDYVPLEASHKIDETGQFAELIYSSIPLSLLAEHFNELERSSDQLARYSALRHAEIVATYRGTVASLPAAIFFRRDTKHLVVAISGTSSALQAAHDARILKVSMPSPGRGSVHAGFWALYRGLKDMLLQGIREGIERYQPSEVVVTGHSMGGSVAYLLCLDLLLAENASMFSNNVALSVVVFGAPRTGNAKLVEYFHSLVKSFREEHTFTEYSIKGYNDGVPTFPPVALGYRHFCKEPFYTAYGKLYRIPPEESECSLFHVPPDSPDEVTIFPRGGHNYYNSRDLEGLKRELCVLAKDPKHAHLLQVKL